MTVNVATDRAPGALTRPPDPTPRPRAALAAGELVILPTETVYGLAADAADPAAVARLYEAKGRPRFNPLIAHVADLAMAAARSPGWTSARCAWPRPSGPGPLTLVAPLGDADAGLRPGPRRAWTRSPCARRPIRWRRPCCAAFGRPIVAPSANRSGRPSPTTFADAVAETGAAAAVALDGGALRRSAWNRRWSPCWTARRGCCGPAR